MRRSALSVAVVFVAGAQGQPTLRISQSSLTFTAATGGDAAPSQVITVVSTDQSPLRFAVRTDNGSAGVVPAWLSVRPIAAVTPARVVITADPGTLPAGAYSGHVIISALVTYPATFTVPVTLVVKDQPPQLELSPPVLRYSGRQQSTATLDQAVLVRNSGGGGPISFKVSIVGAPWITSVAPAEGQTLPNRPVAIRVTVNPSGMELGPRRAALRFTSSAGTKDVPVSLFVADQGPIIDLSPQGVLFDMREGNGTTVAKDITISNAGTDSLDWTAAIVQGGQWLKLRTTSGTAAPLNPGKLTLGTDNTTLRVGSYYALIRISSPQALNSPQFLTVALTVLDPAAPLIAEPGPQGVSFVAVAGQPPPALQPVRVFVSSLASANYQDSAFTDDGGNWLTISTTSGVAATGRAGDVNISVNHANLSPGTYRGEVLYSMSNNEVRAVNVSLVVLPAGAKTYAADRRFAAGCTPAALVPTHTGLVSNFATPAGFPTPIAVRLTNDCGDPVANAQVVVTFTNGDVPLAMTLTSPQDAVYTATWIPAAPSPQMSVIAAASAPGFPLVKVQLNGSVTASSAPLLVANGTLNNLNPVPGSPLAPGTVAQIFGSNLATASGSPGVIPLPASFNGTTVLVNGIEAPLYFVSSGQINAQIPMELAPNRQYPILVSANGALTLPDTLALAPVQPGVAATSPDSRAIAQHGADFSLITPEAPARPGEAIILYLVGMGQTDPLVRSGAAAPSSSLAKAVLQPTVTVDSKPADIFFAGLTPGSVGLYQINVRIPPDAATGDLVISVNQGGVLSNSAVVPVRQ